MGYWYSTGTERDATGTKRWDTGTAQVQRGMLLVQKRGATCILTSGKAKPSVSLTLNQQLLSKSGAVYEQKFDLIFLNFKLFD